MTRLSLLDKTGALVGYSKVDADYEGIKSSTIGILDIVRSLGLAIFEQRIWHMKQEGQNRLLAFTNEEADLRHGSTTNLVLKMLSIKHELLP